jgi:hypothetical protein
MSPSIVVAIALLQFTGPTGARIDLNAEAITSIRDPHAMPEGHWGVGTHCIILVDGGGTIAVRETCDQVRQAILKPTGPCALVCGGVTR